MTRAIRIEPVQADDLDVPVGANFVAFREGGYDWEPKGYGPTKGAAEDRLLAAEPEFYETTCRPDNGGCRRNC